MGDLAPWGVIAGTLARSAPVIAAIGLLVGASTLTVSSANGPAEASSRLGLTDEVVWPFYDQVRDELSVAADDPELRDRVSEALDGAEYELRVETPIDQTYIDITAAADDADTAVAAADAGAQLLVERSAGTDRRTQELQLQFLTDEMELVDRRSEDLRAAVASSFEATIGLGDATDPAASVRRQQLQSERSTLNAELEELTRRRVQLDSEARQLRREIDSSQPEAQVVRRAAALDGDGRPIARPLVAAVVAAALAALGALMLDRYRGRLRNAWYVEGAAGVELLADLRDERRREGVGELAARLEDALLQGDDTVLRGHVVGVMSVAPTLFPAAEIVKDALVAANHHAETAVPDPITGFGNERMTHTTLVPLGQDLDRPERHRRARSCAGLIIVVTQSDRVNDLRRTAGEARRLPAPLLGAILVDEFSPGGSRAEERVGEVADDPSVDAPSM